MFHHNDRAVGVLVSILWLVLIGPLATWPASAGLGTSAGDRRASAAQRPIIFEPNRGQTDSRLDFIGRGQGQTIFLNSSGLVLAIPSATLRIRFAGSRSRTAPSGVDPAPGLSNYFFGSDPQRWRTGVPNYRQVHYRDIYPGIDMVYYSAPEGLEFDFRLAAGADAKIIELALEGAGELSLQPEGLAISLSGRRILLKRPVAYQQISAERRQVEARYVLHGKNRIGIHTGDYDRSKPLVIDPVLSYSTFFGGSGSDLLTAMAVDADGNIYLTGNSASIDFPLANAIQSKPGGVFVTKLNPSGTSVIYSTYLAGPRDADQSGSGPSGIGIAVDRTGNAFIVGQARQGEWPLVNAIQPAFGGGLYNAVIAKLDPTGSRLLFSTYLGGNGSVGNAIALDADGNPVLVGNAGPGFPTTPGALESPAAGGVSGGFVAKLKATGEALIYSTYLGSLVHAGAGAVAVDKSGNAYVTGSVGNNGFPLTPGAFQTTLPPASGLLFPNVCYVSKLNPAGTALVYSTLLGGAGYHGCSAITTDEQGNAFIAGMTSAANFPVTAGAFQSAFRGRIYCIGGSHCVGKTPTPNAFVTKLNSSGTALIYSTYLGGSGTDGGGDSAASIALDAGGNAYLAGFTSSNDFPLQDAIQTAHNCAGCSFEVSPPDVFVAKLDPSGGRLLFSTYLGGSSSDNARAIALDAAGGMILAGTTSGGYASLPFNDFPATANALKKGMAGEDFTVHPADAFVLRLAAQPPTAPVPWIESAVPQVADATAGLFSLNIDGRNFTPLSMVLINGATRSSTFVSSTRLVAGGLRIGGDNPARWAVSVRNPLPGGEISGISNAVVVDAPLCSLPEPAFKLDLGPGFYIAEVRTQAGRPEGYWGMEALVSGGTLDGGLHFGGGLEQGGRSPSFGAFYVPVQRRVRVQLEARPLPDGTNLSITARLFSADSRQIGADHEGATTVAFEQTLDPGFYVLAIQSGPVSSPATFLMSVLTDALAGGMDVGGFVQPGVSGFGALYLAERQQVSFRTLGRPSYGSAGAPCLQLTVFDSARKILASIP